MNEQDEGYFENEGDIGYLPADHVTHLNFLLIYRLLWQDCKLP
jgi:hypothetical protein